MKKILMLICTSLLFTGCKGYTAEDALKDFKSLVKDNSSYELMGNMKIMSNEKEYNYSVDVSYKEGDYYKVNLINQDNDHEQIILKNEDGVYVINPTLNKSFKFQSDWPNNSTQAYILETLLSDIQNDSDRVFETLENGYVFTFEVNYPNNSYLEKGRITFNKKMEIQMVEILDKEDNVNIEFIVTNMEWNKKFAKDYFDLSTNVKDNVSSEDVGKIEDVIYPMYLPLGTTFESEEVVKTDDSDRVILTFKGEKPFILVEEAMNASKDLEVVGATGDLVFYENILGALTDTSVSWTNNGVEYYIIGENLTSEELLEVAASTTTVALVK